MTSKVRCQSCGFEALYSQARAWHSTKCPACRSGANVGKPTPKPASSALDAWRDADPGRIVLVTATEVTLRQIDVQGTRVAEFPTVAAAALAIANDAIGWRTLPTKHWTRNIEAVGCGLDGVVSYL
ncbi:MAG: hypothetical protein ABUL62_19370 [Myxococcales bacterium]